MHADITEAVSGSNVWKITLKDVTRNETFTQTVPYSSTHATAEWIEETPLELGTSPGLSALPNLSNTSFDFGTTNGAPAALKASEEMVLTDSNGNVIGTPSAPDSDLDGFGAVHVGDELLGAGELAPHRRADVRRGGPPGPPLRCVAGSGMDQRLQVRVLSPLKLLVCTPGALTNLTASR